MIPEQNSYGSPHSIILNGLAADVTVCGESAVLLFHVAVGTGFDAKETLIPATIRK